MLQNHRLGSEVVRLRMSNVFRFAPESGPTSRIPLAKEGEQRRMFAGLDVGFKRTAVCVVDEAGRIVWRGVVDTHPEALCGALQRWGGKLAKIGLESGSMTPWLARELAKGGFPVVCMDARAAADAVR